MEKLKIAKFNPSSPQVNSHFQMSITCAKTK